MAPVTRTLLRAAWHLRSRSALRKPVAEKCSRKIMSIPRNDTDGTTVRDGKEEREKERGTQGRRERERDGIVNASPTRGRERPGGWELGGVSRPQERFVDCVLVASSRPSIRARAPWDLHVTHNDDVFRRPLSRRHERRALLALLRGSHVRRYPGSCLPFPNSRHLTIRGRPSRRSAAGPSERGLRFRRLGQ